MFKLLLALGVGIFIAWITIFVISKGVYTPTKQNQLICCVTKAHGTDGTLNGLPNDITADCSPKILTDQFCIDLLNNSGIDLGRFK